MAMTLINVIETCQVSIDTLSRERKMFTMAHKIHTHSHVFLTHTLIHAHTDSGGYQQTDFE